MKRRYDVAIVGAGFSGSIPARILAKQGRKVALIDQSSHPRFAIGESSTPIADLLLRRLGDQYGLSDLNELSTYGSWKRHHPGLACGRKRGFSYYLHRVGEEFTDTAQHDRSLLVAASASDEAADTHWYRPEVDEFLFKAAIAAGAKTFTGCRIETSQPRQKDRLAMTRIDGETCEIESEWVVDASGPARVLARLAGVSPVSTLGETRSVFAHFDRVGSWTQLLNRLGFDTSADPFDSDAAAQHHLLDGGWMWMLRLDNGITSVGLTSPSAQRLDWSAQRSISKLMEGASMVAPPEGVGSAGGMRQLFDPVVDRRSVMLPTAAASVDPLHSTGIAHALAGIDRVAAIILAENEAAASAKMNQYRESVLHEATVCNQMVKVAYETMNDFPRFVAACMLYFVGAIACEERFGAGETPSCLWNADDQRFVEMIGKACQWLGSDAPTEQVTAQIREAIEPWNTAGLMDPAVKNRYAYTATK